MQGKTEKGMITEHVDENKAHDLLQEYYKVQNQYPYQLQQIAFYFEQGWKACEYAKTNGYLK